MESAVAPTFCPSCRRVFSKAHTCPAFLSGRQIPTALLRANSLGNLAKPAGAASFAGYYSQQPPTCPTEPETPGIDGQPGSVRVSRRSERIAQAKVLGSERENRASEVSRTEVVVVEEVSRVVDERVKPVSPCVQPSGKRSADALLTPSREREPDDGFRLPSKAAKRQRRLEAAPKPVVPAPTAAKGAFTPIVFDGVRGDVGPLQFAQELARRAPGVRIRRTVRLPRGGILVVPARAEDGRKLLDASRLWPSDAFGGSVRVHLAGAVSERKEGDGAAKVVVHGLPGSVSEQELKEVLIESGWSVEKVVRLATTDSTKKVMPRLIVLGSQDEATKALREGFFVGALHLRCRAFAERPAPVQCFHCQGFGHVSAACVANVKCVRCGGPHAKTDCPNSRAEAACANCGGKHSSAYKGCQTYKEARADVAVAQKSYAQAAKPKPEVSRSNRKVAPVPARLASTEVPLPQASNEQRGPESSASEKTLLFAASAADNGEDQFGDKLITFIIAAISLLAGQSNQSRSKAARNLCSLAFGCFGVHLDSKSILLRQANEAEKEALREQSANNDH